MKETALTFIGHGTCYGIDKEMIKTVLRPLIADKGIDTFYSGGMGDFDWVCARAVYELKAEFPHIRNYLVIPYLSFTIRNKDIFDEIIYPEGFEKYYFKAAITKRYHFLVDNVAYALCYVKHDWGGAAQTFKYAQKKKIKIINVGA